MKLLCEGLIFLSNRKIDFFCWRLSLPIISSGIICKNNHASTYFDAIRIAYDKQYVQGNTELGYFCLFMQKIHVSYLRIKIWFFDVHQMMKLVGGAKISWSKKCFL